MILLSALPDDGADIGREQDAARAIHDDVPDRKFAARRLAARGEATTHGSRGVHAALNALFA